MSDFISLTCPSCGGNVEIREYNKKYLCSFCGNDVVIRAGSELEKSINQIAIGELSFSINELNQQKQDLYKKLLRIDKDITRINNGESYKKMSLFAFTIILLFVGSAIILRLIYMDYIVLKILGELPGSKFLILLILIIAICFFVFGITQYLRISNLDLAELKMKKNEIQDEINYLIKNTTSKQDQLANIREFLKNN